MLLITLPHSGERIPEACFWLQNLEARVLLRDVDRFVDQLYLPVIDQFKIPYVSTQWHRYAADLNRQPQDIDQDSVIGATLPSGKMSRGFHWVKTTLGEVLMESPIDQATHQGLVELIYYPFHSNIHELIKPDKETGRDVWHLDLHSMPSVGTSEHRDPGEHRADIVVSDNRGKSADSKFVDLVIAAYVRAGFKVGYNWPYYGGRITEAYGNPKANHHTVQVELNRKLYMDEATKEKNATYGETQKKLSHAIEIVRREVLKWSGI